MTTTAQKHDPALLAHLPAKTFGSVAAAAETALPFRTNGFHSNVTEEHFTHDAGANTPEILPRSAA